MIFAILGTGGHGERNKMESQANL